MRSSALHLALVLGVAGGCILDREGRAVDEGTGGIGGVGDCVVEGEELCDDCNQMTGDGCDELGLLEPGWECVAAGESCQHVDGLETIFGDVTTEIGDMDAVPPFEDTCPAGSLLVGLEATNSGGSPEGDEYLSTVVPLCAEVAMGNTGQFEWSATQEGESHGIVPQPVAYPSLVCPSDQFAVGFRAWEQAEHITRVSLICQALSFDGEKIIFSADTDDVGPMGSTVGNGSGRIRCPTNLVAVALIGSAPDVLDRVGLRCASVTPSFE